MDRTGTQSSSCSSAAGSSVSSMPPPSTSVAGGAAELYFDRPDRLLSLHVVLEALIVAISLGLGLYLLRGW